jgi:hypothetical protein
MKSVDPLEIDAALEKVLQEALEGACDLSLVSRSARSRAAGFTLLAFACACIAAVSLLPKDDRPFTIGVLVLGMSAILLLIFGAWLIDRASKQEMQPRRSTAGEAIRRDLADQSGVTTQASARRQHHFGLSMLALAAFCICVACAPLPGKQGVDVGMWSIFSITLIGIGAWSMRGAKTIAVDAKEMLNASRRRVSARKGIHIR